MLANGKFAPELPPRGTADQFEEGFGQCAKKLSTLSLVSKPGAFPLQPCGLTDHRIEGATANEDTVRGFALQPSQPGFEIGA